MEVSKRREKKRYGWLIFFAVLNWLAIILVAWKIEPESIRDIILPGSYLPAVLLLMGGFFWLLSILFMSSSRALRWTLAITIFLELRLIGLGTVMNGLLILGLLLSWEIYTLKSKPTEKINSDML